MTQNLVQKVKNAALATVVSLGLTGCVNDGNLLNPRGDALLQDLGVLAAGTFVQEGIKGKVNPDASNIQQNVYVNGNQGQAYQTAQEPITYGNRIETSELEIYTSSGAKDLNEDGKISDNEIFNLGKVVFNYNEEEIHYVLVNHSKSGTAIFKSWSRNGELLGETMVPYDQDYAVGRCILPGKFATENKDFMDKVKERGPGGYKLSVTLEDGRTFWSDLVLME